MKQRRCLQAAALGIRGKAKTGARALASDNKRENQLWKAIAEVIGVASGIFSQLIKR